MVYAIVSLSLVSVLRRLLEKEGEGPG